MSTQNLTELKLSRHFPITLKGQVLEVLGVPFGGHIGGKDEDGEFFSPNTEIGMQVGDRRPVFYNHGLTPRGTRMLDPKPITQAKYIRQDKKGHWFEIDMPEDENLAKRILQAAKDGLAKASSGAINYLVRKKKGGEITSWPIGELTLIDQAMNRQPSNQLASVHLKTAFDNAGIEFPEAFLKSGELERDAANEEEGDNLKILNKETKMSDKDEKDTKVKESQAEAKTTQDIDVQDIVAQAVATIKAEEKEQDKLNEVLEKARQEGVEEGEKKAKAQIEDWFGARGVAAFNQRAGKHNKSEGMDELQHWMLTGDAGGEKVLKAYVDKKGVESIDLDMPSARELKAAKALQEGSDTEGGYLVPDDFRGRIVALREQFAWTRNVGIDIMQTSLLHVKVPKEATAIGKLDVTAEEGTYADSDPIFGEVDIQVYKFTKTNKVSDELLADEKADFMGWYATRIAEIAASTESYYVAVGTGSSQPQGVFVGGTAGLTFDSADNITADEIPELYYKLPNQYRSDAAWLMNNDTEGYLRKIRDANNWAFDYMRPDNIGVRGAWRYQSFYGGNPIYTEAGCATIATAVKTVLIGNFRYYALADHTALTIKRNPYLYMATGQMGLFCDFRFGGAVTQAEAFQYGTQA